MNVVQVSRNSWSCWSLDWNWLNLCWRSWQKLNPKAEERDKETPVRNKIWIPFETLESLWNSVGDSSEWGRGLVTRLPTIHSTRIKKGIHDWYFEKTRYERKTCGIQKKEKHCPKRFRSTVVTKIHFEENLLAVWEIPDRNFCLVPSKKQNWTGHQITETATATLWSSKIARFLNRAKTETSKSAFENP